MWGLTLGRTLREPHLVFEHEPRAVEDPPAAALDTPADEWADLIEGWLARNPSPIDRVAVVSETASTQDAARRLSGGEAGLLVLADRQTRGRGRLGRSWHDGGRTGLAATFVLDGSRWDDGELSLAGGVGACMAVECALGLTPPGFFESASWERQWSRAKRAGTVITFVTAPTLWVLGSLAGSFRHITSRPRPGLRWPNDVVEDRSRRAKKVAGVLVERDGDLAYVGVGINVLHRREDWRAATADGRLAREAVSLRQLGGHASRIDVALALLAAMTEALEMAPEELVRAWRRRDVLIGRRVHVRHGSREYYGRVLDIDPANQIVMKCVGQVLRLPARATTLVRS